MIFSYTVSVDALNRVRSPIAGISGWVKSSSSPLSGHNSIFKYLEQTASFPSGCELPSGANKSARSTRSLGRSRPIFGVEVKSCPGGQCLSSLRRRLLLSRKQNRLAPIRDWHLKNSEVLAAPESQDQKLL